MGDIPVRTRTRTPTPMPAPKRAVKLEEPELVMHEGTIQVDRVMYGQEEERVQERIYVPIFSTAAARVRIGGSITKNLGNYNSARFEVSVEVPCYPEKSEIDRAKKFASQLVDDYLTDEMQQAGAQK